MSAPAIRLVARLWIEEADQILVARLPGRGYALLPGGGVEPGEPVAAAAARELEEETGIARARLRIRHALGVSEQSWLDADRGPVHALEVVLAAEVEGLRAGDPVPAREPHLAFGWLPLAALPAARLEPRALRPILLEWRARGAAAFASDMAAPQGAWVVVSSGKRER